MSEDAGAEHAPEKGSIGLLAQVFPRGVVDAAINRAGVRELKNRALPARLMVYFVIGMWLWSGIGYVRVLRKVTAGLRWAAAEGERTPLPYDGSIAKARARLGEAVMADLFAGCAGPVGRIGEAGMFFAELRVASLDGTVFDAKPTPENLAAFKLPAGGVLPQVRLLAFAECGTMALLGAASDNIAVDERTVATRLLGRFAPGMLVLVHRGSPLLRPVARRGGERRGSGLAGIGVVHPETDRPPARGHLPDATARPPQTRSDHGAGGGVLRQGR